MIPPAPKIPSRFAAPRKALSGSSSKATQLYISTPTARAARIHARSRRILFPRCPRLRLRRSPRLHGRRLGRSARSRSPPPARARPSARRPISSRSPPASNASKHSEASGISTAIRRIEPTCSNPAPNKTCTSESSARQGQPLETRIAALRPKVDLFFDKVLVNAPDASIRRNRLTLLHNLLTEFSTIADFSEIVTERAIMTKNTFTRSAAARPMATAR